MSFLLPFVYVPVGVEEINQGCHNLSENYHCHPFNSVFFLALAQVRVLQGRVQKLEASVHTLQEQVQGRAFAARTRSVTCRFRLSHWVFFVCI